MDNNYNPYNANVQQTVEPKPVPKKNSIIAMALGISSIGFGSLGFVGIILAAISMSFRKKYLEESGGVSNGFATAAKGTSIGGLIFSILMTIFWIVYVLVIVFIMRMAVGGMLDF